MLKLMVFTAKYDYYNEINDCLLDEGVILGHGFIYRKCSVPQYLPAESNFGTLLQS